MSLDAEKSVLTKHGTVKIKPDGQIIVAGFEGDNCTCRDVAVLAMLWAIGQLQAEVMADVQEPGGGRCVVG
jgi:hypothetical protein